MVTKFLSFLLLLSPAAFAQQATHFDGKTWWEYVKFFADDKLEGRDTGSKGLREAESYIAAELKKEGLQPAGTNGFYQPMQFKVRQLDEKNCRVALVREGKEQPLTLGEEVILSSRLDLAPHIEAPLVFVGYGLNIAEMHYNDFEGVDLKGKVAVIVNGSPAEIAGPLASHYQTAAERWKALKAAGAIGVMNIINPASMDVPWSRIALNRNHPSMDLVGDEFNDTADEQFSATMNPAHADLLFAGTGHNFAEIAALAKERKPLPRFVLPLSVRATTRLKTWQVESANVVAKLEGSDPVLKNEYVVLSAHIDHIGVGEPINGDRINNGAMDNASGSAFLLDLARSFKQSPEKMKRSVLFVWVTGEEKGLLGSKYFAAHPTVPTKAMAADLNTDMFLPIVPLKVLTVYGLKESSLGDDIRKVAEARGVRIQDDPEPLRNLFIRSDQYNFIRHGVPAMAAKIGFDPGTPEQQIFKDWLTNRYHAPSDDTAQPVDLGAAAQFEEIMRDFTISVANDAQRPAWNTDSFFRRYAEGN